MTYHVRLARAGEGPRLNDIEQVAGEAFDGLGLTDEALDHNLPLDELEQLIDAGTVWVACTADDEPVGFVAVVLLDGAPDIGGRNLASRPMEVVLMGMGGCTAIDVVAMLKKQRRDIEGVEVSLVAERADDHPKVFTSVKVVYTVRGRKLNKALIERAVSLSDEKYCSATAMVRKSAAISHEVVLVEV